MYALSIQSMFALAPPELKPDSSTFHGPGLTFVAVPAPYAAVAPYCLALSVPVLQGDPSDQGPFVSQVQKLLWSQKPYTSHPTCAVVPALSVPALQDHIHWSLCLQDGPELSAILCGLVSSGDLAQLRRMVDAGERQGSDFN